MRKRKAGCPPLSPEVAATIANLDEYLFSGRGMTVDDYFLERGVGTVVGFHRHGLDYDMLISDEHLAEAIERRLLELGVEVRDR